MIDFTDGKILKELVKEFESEENIRRKRRSYVAYDIYNNNQHKYVMACLAADYPKESVEVMRKITSINFAKRIVDVEANVYKHAPNRVFNGASDDVIEQCMNLYKFADVDRQHKLVNRFYRMDEQCACIPVPNKQKGIISLRKLQNWQYDVVPDPDFPEQALAYIIPVGTKPGQYNDASFYSFDSASDNLNQLIADRDDFALGKRQYILWSPKYNFMFNGRGEIITPEEDVENEVGIMPLDVSMPKQNSFLLQNDNNLSRFTIDFLCAVSDFAENMKMQGYSQAILSAVEAPKDMVSGPHRALFLEKNPELAADLQPEFAFATPSPDLQGTKDGLLMIMSLFLSSRGHKTNVVTGGSNTESFASGLERLLAMIEQHDSSIDDFSLFKTYEQMQFEQLRRISNYYRDNPSEDFELKPELQLAEIPEDTEMSIEFHEPQMIETEKEKQARLRERLDDGTLSKKRFIMLMDGLDEEQAQEVLDEAQEEMFGPIE